ncbi:unnamed protein product [Prorocentrum cordatum]|uniref:HTH OST-type domain-containing protein n=1 Tax=Prorocentrum cordatum TaxID=2364126 RepID=A0ABN9UDK7_9DINO|nr:unnamed protein product [Polarella glacialis]
MQVKLGETNKLDEFQENLHKMQAEAESSGGNTKSAPQFWMPSPLPERVLMQIHELFLRSEGHEIPLRNFIATWNAHFANETLAYRTLGFRDVRGLLSQASPARGVGARLAMVPS